MNATVRNRLSGLGALWGLYLAVVPAFVVADLLRPDGFLVAAGQRAARTKKGGRNPVLAGLGTGLLQGRLIGGGVAALLFWGVMAFVISGFAPGGTVDLSSLMRPQVFLGSFFVSLSVFLYALVGGILLGPLFGTLVNRVAGVGAKGGLR